VLVQSRCDPTAPLDFLEKLLDRLVEVSSFRLHVCGCGPKCPCNGGVLIQNVTASILGNLPPRTKAIHRCFYRLEWVTVIANSALKSVFNNA
jgi:hypothetical protein